MKLNIFQKISFLVYLSIILLIIVYFVPYQGIQNNLDIMIRQYKTNSSYHSNILNDGYGTMSYLRFLIYLFIPTLSFYFVCKYLNKMNSLEPSVYKKKAKKELYVFFVFIGIVIVTIFFLFGKNQYAEIRKERLKSEISEINYSFDKLRKELSKRPPLDLSGAQDILKESVDEYGIKIKKPTEKLNLDLSGYYETYKKNIDIVLNKTPNVRLNIIRKKQIESNIKELIVNGSSFDDLNKMIVDYLKIFSEDGIKKTKLELELKELRFYNKNDIKFILVFAFLGSFILLYIIRPLFSMFKGMLEEVR